MAVSSLHVNRQNFEHNECCDLLNRDANHNRPEVAVHQWSPESEPGGHARVHAHVEVYMHAHLHTCFLSKMRLNCLGENISFATVS